MEFCLDPQSPLLSAEGSFKRMLKGKRIVLAIGDQLSLAAIALIPVIRDGSVGNFTTQQEAAAACHAKQPDLLLVTDELQQGNGIALLNEVRKLSPDTKALIFLKRETSDVVRDAINAHATGVIFVSSIGLGPGGDFMRSLAAACEGSVYIPDVVRERAGFSLKPLPEFSEKETEVLRQLCQGRSNKEIAAELMVSPETVKTHVSSLIGLMQVKDRTSVVIQAIRAGF